ncbi:MAG: hypothetical protein ACXWC1_33970, partial [Burkholderiales bacterium]
NGSLAPKSLIESKVGGEIEWFAQVRLELLITFSVPFSVCVIAPVVGSQHCFTLASQLVG